MDSGIRDNDCHFRPWSESLLWREARSRRPQAEQRRPVWLTPCGRWIPTKQYSTSSHYPETPIVPDASQTHAAELPDPRSPLSFEVFSSLGPELIRLIQDPSPAGYAVVDLGAGRQWLTSRLFIFAELLGRMRGLRSFVFLRTDDSPRRFIGTASPPEVRWTLAADYPWLEAAFAKAYAQLPKHEIRSPGGALDIVDASQLFDRLLGEPATLGTAGP